MKTPQEMLDEAEAALEAAEEAMYAAKELAHYVARVHDHEPHPFYAEQCAKAFGLACHLTAVRAQARVSWQQALDAKYGLVSA